MKSLRNALTQLSNRHSTALKKNKNSVWIHITWGQYADRVEQIFYSLICMKVQKGERIGIFSKSRPKWCYTDCAIIASRATSVPIYSNISDEDLTYIINKSKIRILFCENIHSLKQIKRVKNQCPCIEKIICFDDCWDKHIHPLRWDLFLTLGESLRREQPNLLEESCEKINDADIATIVFTSGVTKTHKGVPLNHEQIDAQIWSNLSALDITDKDSSLSVLPFAHIFGRLELWGHICSGYTISFAQSQDMLEKNIRQINPTFMMVVPRILEKIQVHMKARTPLDSIKKRFLGKTKKTYALIEKKLPTKIKKLESLLISTTNKYLPQQYRHLLGRNLRFIVCGGASLNSNLAQFFFNSGILVLEGYGLTETAGVISLNTPSRFEFGTVGQPLENVEIRLAEDGEILVKSKTTMKHYLGEKGNIEWLETGDIGHFNNKGFLVITDRKKDLIKTSNGKYVVPSKLEKKLLADPFISDCHIHGNNRKYVVALVCLSKSELLQWAEENNLSYANIGNLTQHPKVHQKILSLIGKINKSLATHETIKDFVILRNEFSVETGELTPSFKVKRKFCDEKYSDTIENLYNLS